MKTCPKCGELVGDNMNICFSCRYDFNAGQKQEIEKQKKTEELIKKSEEEAKLIRSKIADELAEYKAKDRCLYDITGCRGRSIKVYENRVVINTDVTLGSILTSNATDGEKTIFYEDIIGIQFKPTGLAIGYLQLETASGQMNNASSNAFSENTFTFDGNTDEIIEMKEYITMRVAKTKGR